MLATHLRGHAASSGPVRSGRRRILTAGALLGAFAVAAGFMTSTVAYASPSTYYVDNTGSCHDASNAGTTTVPFCTITYAAGQVKTAGTTVLVRAGTYTDSAITPKVSGIAGSPITFTANSGVKISGGTKAFALSSRNYIVISGFTITKTSFYGISISGGSNDTVSGNTLTQTGADAIYISGGNNDTVSGNTESNAGTAYYSPGVGIRLINVAGGLVNGNVTHDNTAHGIYLAGSTTGVTVQGNTSYHNAYQYERNANGIDDIAPGNSIIGNITYANEDTGINMYTGGNNALVADNVTYGNGDHGIDDLNVIGGRIIGNTVYGNCTDGINVEGTSGNYIVENNVSMNNAVPNVVINPTPIIPNPSTGVTYSNDCKRRVGNIGIYDSAPSSTTPDYNLVWQSGAGTEFMWTGVAYNLTGPTSPMCTSTGQECHGIVHDPGFVNAAAANFQLTKGSKAIDAANTAVSGQQPADILGVSPYDDMGAYEYTAPPPAGPTAALSVSPASGTAPLAVTADASASAAGSSPISSYTFNFGDGTTAGPQASPTATHTYSSAGSYTVTVTATDGNNLTSQAGQGGHGDRAGDRADRGTVGQPGVGDGAAGGDRGCVCVGGGQLADQFLHVQFR